MPRGKKQHMNPETLEINECNATVRECGYGEQDHFPSLKAAQEEQKRRLEKENPDYLKGEKKSSNKSSKSKNPAMTEIKNMKKEMADLQKVITRDTNKIKKGEKRIKENNDTIAAMNNLKIDDSIKKTEKNRLTNENKEIQLAIENTKKEISKNKKELSAKTRQWNQIKKEFNPVTETTTEARAIASSYRYAGCSSLSMSC